MLNGNFTNSGGIYHYLVCNNGTNIINDEGGMNGTFTGDCTGTISLNGSPQMPFEYDHINCNLHYTSISAVWPRRKCNGIVLFFTHNKVFCFAWTRGLA